MIDTILLFAFLIFGVFIVLKCYKEDKKRSLQRDIDDRIFKELLLCRLNDISVSLDYCSGRRIIRKEDVIK